MNTTINKNQTWCSMWGNAVSIAEHRPESYAKDITLRYPVYAPFDGTALRFTFDNYCGSEPVSITKATVSIADCDFNCDDITRKINLSCPMQESATAQITFSGNSSVTIAAHERIISDDIFFQVQAGQTTPSYFSFKNSTGNVSNSLLRRLCCRHWLCPWGN